MSESIQTVLESLGVKRNDAHIYLTLLTLGSASLRTIALESSITRGTTYDALKRLMDLGLVTYVDAKTHRYFTAEDPGKLRKLVKQQELQAVRAKERIEQLMPQLRDMIGSQAQRPSVRYYEGQAGVKDILHDVLTHTKKLPEKHYRVYSSAGIRNLIAAAWPKYNRRRLDLAIHVKAIAIGKGGELHGLDERRWLSKKQAAATYIFIYGDKTAYVAADDQDRLLGVIIDDAAITSTQRMIFDAVWESLPASTRTS